MHFHLTKFLDLRSHKEMCLRRSLSLCKVRWMAIRYLGFFMVTVKVFRCICKVYVVTLTNETCRFASLHMDKPVQVKHILC